MKREARNGFALPQLAHEVSDKRSEAERGSANAVSSLTRCAFVWAKPTRERGAQRQRPREKVFS